MASQHSYLVVTHGGRAILNIFTSVLDSDYLHFQDFKVLHTVATLKIMLPFHHIGQLISNVRDVFLWIASNYENIKVALFDLDGKNLGDSLRTIYIRIGQLMQNVEEIRTISAFYSEYQSWFEEVHFSELVDIFMKDMNR